MSKIINLTPHVVNVMDHCGNVIVSYRSEGNARVKEMSEVIDSVNDIEVVKMTFGVINGLPEPTEGTFYIVPRIVAEAALASGRSVDDLLMTVDFIGDEDDRSYGCRRFSRL